MAAPVLASSASFADGAATTSRTINKPSGTASGDWLFLFVSIDCSTVAATFTTPTGFTEIFNQTDPQDANIRFAAYKRKADGTEGATFTIASTNEFAAGVIVRVTGADSTDAVDVFSYWSGELNLTRSAGVAATMEAYAACSDGSLVLQIATMDDGTGTFTATPSGHTSVAAVGTNSSGTHLAVYEKSMASQGYVGANSWTFSDNAEEGFTMTLVIRASTATTFPAQPVIRSVSAQRCADANAVTLLKPYGAVDNDLLMLVQTAKVASSLTPPAGFTSIQDTSNGVAVYHQAYYKLASSEGASYSVANSTQSGTLTWLARITNAATSSPIDTSSSATGTSTTPTASTITPSVDNCLILFAAGNDDDEVTTNLTAPTGFDIVYSESTDEGADCGLQICRDEQTTAAATGSITSTAIVASEEWVAFAIAIKPAGAAGDVTASPTGVAGTGGVGSPTVTGEANVTPTGVSGTGAVGDPTINLLLVVTPDGVAGTGVVGDPTVKGDGSVVPTGVAGTGAVGDPTVTGDANVPVTGVSGAGAVGDVTVDIAGDTTAQPTGVNGTGAVGDPTVTGDANVPLDGVSATGAVGDPTVAGDAIATVSGVEGTGAAGDVMVSTTDGEAPARAPDLAGGRFPFIYHRKYEEARAEYVRRRGNDWERIEKERRVMIQGALKKILLPEEALAEQEREREKLAKEMDDQIVLESLAEPFNKIKVKNRYELELLLLSQFV